MLHFVKHFVFCELSESFLRIVFGFHERQSVFSLNILFYYSYVKTFL